MEITIVLLMKLANAERRDIVHVMAHDDSVSHNGRRAKEMRSRALHKRYIEARYDIETLYGLLRRRASL